MINPFLQIARNTLRETLRQPIFFLVLLSCLILIGLLPASALFVFREQLKLVIDSALAGTMLFGWITAVLSATYTISREIHNGTVLLVLSKPITRPLFIGAKICGILAALAVFMFLSSLATLIAVRVAIDQFNLDLNAMGLFYVALALSCACGGVMNFLKRSSFSMSAILAMLVILPLATIGIAYLPASGGEHAAYHWNMLPALFLISFAVLALGTLATALSTRFDLVPNLLICSCVFILGLVSDYLFGRLAEASLIASLLYSIIPNWQLFWMADALAAHIDIPVDYVIFAGFYFLLFLLLFAGLAAVMFQNREIGKQDLV